MTGDQRYPALISDRLTPFYDLFVKLFFPERRIKRALITQARLAPGQRVLDVGAGTGTLAILIKQDHPNIQVTALDGDPQILTIARQKATQAGVQIAFDLGNAAGLPYPDASFERVVSSLVFSLLSTAGKQRALSEAFRVLRGGGELSVADFGPPRTGWSQLLSRLQRRFEPIAGNLDGLLPILFREANFVDISVPEKFDTLLGSIYILQGWKPE